MRPSIQLIAIMLGVFAIASTASAEDIVCRREYVHAGSTEIIRYTPCGPTLQVTHHYRIVTTCPPVETRPLPPPVTRPITRPIIVRPIPTYPPGEFEGPLPGPRRPHIVTDFAPY